MRINHSTPLLVAAAAAIAIATAPSAWAAPSEQPCFDAGKPTNCQKRGNVQIHTSPHAVRPVYPHTHNPKYRGVGYQPKFPTLGHEPYWQEFGYDPRWNGFHHQLWKPTTCDFLRRSNCPGGQNDSLLG